MLGQFSPACFTNPAIIAETSASNPFRRLKNDNNVERHCGWGIHRSAVEMVILEPLRKSRLGKETLGANFKKICEIEMRVASDEMYLVASGQTTLLY